MKVLKLLTFFISVTSFCYGQCDVKIEYSHEKKSALNFSVYLQSEINLKNVKVQLYDLYEGKIIKEGTINLTELRNEVFKDVKPSLYYIYVTFEGCHRKGLGGMSGFKLGDE